MTSDLKLAANPGLAGVGKVRWYEWPLLYYFMQHFFPPLPDALPNVCLALALIGVVADFAGRPAEALRRLNHPLVWTLVALFGLLALSIFQAPADLQPESWHQLLDNLGKGGLFGVVLVLHMDSEAKARRLLVAGVIAPCGMLLHYLYTTWQIVHQTGVFPVQRDYLYWLLLYFPLAIAAFFAAARWRIPALLACLGIVALAATTGFRGAMLSLTMMAVAFLILPGGWRFLAAGAAFAAAAVAWIVVKFPEQGRYVLGKFEQTDGSGRITNHWLPAWHLSLERPWLGHGFGHRIFSRLVHDGVPTHPSWLPSNETLAWAPASPHSISFEVLFSAGFPGLIALCLLAFLLLRYLVPPLWRWRAAAKPSVCWLFTYAMLVSLFGSYAVFAQFETPAWRSLPILVGLALAGLRLVDREQASLQGGA